VDAANDEAAQRRLVLDRIEEILKQIDDDVARRNLVLPPSRPEKAPPAAELRAP
jgi:hypothetical protein